GAAAVGAVADVQGAADDRAAEGVEAGDVEIRNEGDVVDVVAVHHHHVVPAAGRQVVGHADQVIAVRDQLRVRNAATVGVLVVDLHRHLRVGDVVDLDPPAAAIGADEGVRAVDGHAPGAAARVAGVDRRRAWVGQVVRVEAAAGGVEDV